MWRLLSSRSVRSQPCSIAAMLGRKHLIRFLLMSVAWDVCGKKAKAVLFVPHLFPSPNTRLSSFVSPSFIPLIHSLTVYRYVNLIRVSPKCVCIVMEFADDGDLSELIGRRKACNQPLEEDLVLRYLVQVTQALIYIHSRGILHRDVKTANVFLNKSGIIKLGDFGIARILEDRGEASISARTCRTPVGTPLYMSPELCLGERYGPKSDIWALGCVLYEVSLKELG